MKLKLSPGGKHIILILIAILLIYAAKCQNITENNGVNNNVHAEKSATRRHVSLWVQGLICVRGSWPDGPTVQLVTDMALEHIHALPSMLPGHRIRFSWVDTMCSPGIGAFRMINNLAEQPPKVIIMGAALSPVSQSTALLSHHYNLTQISYDSGSPALSNKNLYPNFFRVYQTSLGRVQPTVAVCDYFEWKKVATIHQAQDVFAIFIHTAVGTLKANNITVITSEIFTDDPRLQVHNLKSHDARIIIIESYVGPGLILFCEAYKIGLYGPRIVWLIGNWWPTKWWESANEQELGCTQEQLMEVDLGFIRTGQFQVNPDQEAMTVAGYTPRELETIWQSRTKGLDVFFEAARYVFYDTVWALALALNATLTETMREDGTSPLSTFTYSDWQLGQTIKRNMAKVVFSGSRSRTEFDEFGDCKSAVQIVQGKDKKIVGMYGADDTGRQVLTWFNEGIKWPGNRVPRDSTLYKTKVDFLWWDVYISIVAVAVLGTIMSLGFLGFNFILRNKRLIKMSSPNMNNILLLGCILIYATAFLHEQQEQYVVAFCTARNFTMTVGFSLVFGSLFSKTWRVHVIFTTKNVKGVGIHDSQLVGMVVGLVGVNLLILALWAILDMYQVSLLDTTVQVILTEKEDILIQHQVAVCTSANGVYFKWSLYIIQAALLTFGVFLAWETKGVKVEALNDSQLIGVCIYNVVILSALGVGLGAVLEQEPHLVSTLIDIFLLLGATITQFVIFVPKVIGVFSGQADVAPSTVNKTETSTA